MIFRPGGGPVYRGMRNRGCFEYPATVRVEAFLRREIAQPDGTWVKKDSKGVSVAGSENSVFAEITPKGIAGIESMILREIWKPRTQEALDIILAPPPKESDHANIVGIPYLSENREIAEFLAGELARNSTLTSQERFTNLRRTHL